ncbi:MAG: biotin--[acetyl-CoA-carboxylase] ligase [Burkholderiaceae bacterium]|nr:biotin--[acetyl-CoA-carboxylase] ligase [Burkholderiaceae bacterium]
MHALDAGLIRELAACADLRVEVVAQAGSTNQLLMDAAFGSDPAPPCLLAAARQTAGRGRRGRTWLSPPGRSIAFSIAFERRVRLDPPPAAAAVAIGAAAAAALSRWAPDVQLKWPNDLQRARRKLGGILLECRRNLAATTPGGAAIERIVVGIGLNLLAPDGPALSQPACGLFDGDVLPAHAAEAVIGGLAAAFVPAMRRFLAEGLGPFLDIWRRFDAFDGAQVALMDDERVLVVGRALGLDASGGLRVDTPQGVRVISSGELSLRRLESGA